MPVIRPIEASRSIDIGGIPDTRIDSSVGQGLSQIGGAISNHANMQNQMALRRQQMEQQVDDFATNQAFQRWQDDNALDFAKQQEAMNPSGKGFTDNVSGIYTKRSEEFLKSVPDSLKPKFAELVATSRNQWIDKGAAAEIDQRNNWYRTSITERQQTLQNQVFNDPAMFDAAKQDAHRTIDASGLSPTEKEKLKKQADEMFSLTIGERDIRTSEANPSYANGAAGRLGITGAVRTAHGGDAMSILRKFEGFRETPYWDVNAHRIGYGSDTVTTADGRIVRVEKGMKVSRADAERDLARRTKEFERTSVSQVGVENWNNLPANVQAALVSVAYNYGSLPSNVADAARSGDINRIAAAVEFRGNDNGGVNKKRRAEEASIIRGSSQISGNAPAFDAAAMDPRYANLTLQQRLTISDRMQAAAQRGQTAINAQNKAAYDAGNNNLLLGIHEEKITSVEQIYAAGLKPEDTLVALKALEYRQGNQMAASKTIEALAGGTWAGDVYNSKDKKNLDLAGDAIMKNVPTDQQQHVFEGVTKQTGYVPESYYNKLRAGLDSQIPNDFGQAMELAYRINQASPIAFGRSVGGDGIQKKVNDYDYMINKLAMKPEDAWKRLAEENNPDKIRDRKALEPLEKQFVKDLTDGDLNKQVVQIFDEWWTSDPQVGFTNQTSVAIQSDYLEMARREFVRNGGDAGRAKDNASKQMKDLYGVTQITGSKVIMRNPPDKYWPHVPNVSDPMGYVKTQLIDELKAAFPDDKTLNSREDPNGITMTINGISFDKNDVATRRAMESRFRDDAINRVRLTPLLSTQQEIDAKKMPGYMVSYVDEKGNEQVLNNGRPWNPDFTTALNAQREEQAEREVVAASVGQQMRGIAEDQTIMGQMEDGGREATLDAFIAGPASTPQTIANPNPGFSAPVPQSANPSVQGNLKQQRTQLFQNAKDSGMLNGDQ